MKYRIIKENGKFQIQLKDFLFWHYKCIYIGAEAVALVETFDTLDGALSRLEEIKEETLEERKGSNIVEEGEF